VAHSILVVTYDVLRDGASYRELGGHYFDHLNAQRLTRYHTQRLAALGYEVTSRNRRPEENPNPIPVGSSRRDIDVHLLVYAS
jgi:hypothetical protein